MKKIYFLFVINLACMAAMPAQGLFSKIHGSPDDDYPTAVKVFGDGLYVCGYRIIGGAEYGTFSKFDLATGNPVWDRFIEVQSRLVDFEYDPVGDAFLIVGYTYPFSSTVDNRSLLVKIDDSGNRIFSRMYNHSGRELFERIIRHPNPANSAYPYYISGVKNPVSTPSSNDVVMLYNINAAGMVNWTNEYAYTTNPTDDEFQRGLIPYQNGNVILTGNVASNDGFLMVASGINGAALTSRRIMYPIDINNGILLPNGMLAIVGEDYTNFLHDGIVMLFNSLLNPVASYDFTSVTRFEDIWLDQYNRLYTIGPSKTTPTGFNYQVVHQLSYSGTAPFVVNVNWAKYLQEPGVQEYYVKMDQGNISVTPVYDRIFYADSRQENGADPTPMGFGGQDLLIGSFDLDLSSGCSIPLNSPTNSFAPHPFPEIVNWVGFQAPVPTDPPIVKIFSPGTHDFCAPAPCDCNFTWTTGNCSQVQFTANCTPAQAGNYTYEWDFDCTGPGLPVTFTVGSPTHTIPFTFPCGGGVFNVCLKVTAPDGTVCNITHVVTVPNICCGQVSGKLDCVSGAPYEYTYTITVTDPPGSTNCAQPVLTVAAPAVLASPVFYSPVAGGVVLTGSVSVTDPVPLNLLFTIQTNCVCISTGKPITCTQPLSLQTYCCKEIYVPNLEVCKDDPTLDVPVQVLNGAVLNNISSVSWYVMPKPAGGCPSTPWGGVPYQQISSTSLTPLHLLPAYLNGDLCVYAVVTLNDGPCTQIISNIAAMVQFCAPSTCVLTGGSIHCYTGTPIIPGPLNVAISSPPTACTPIWEWYEPGNPNPVQIGGLTFQPITGLSIQNPANCYEDFIYKVVITDACGKHTCTETVRLYNDNAPVGTLTILSPDVPPLCPGEDAILQYKPACAGEPENWTWYYSTTGPPPPGLIPGAGTANSIYYTNQLYQDTWFMVEKQNGPVCPADQIHLKIDVRDPLMITNFITQPVPVCDPTGVYMQVDFTPIPPDPPCSVTVEWYKDGNLVGVTPPAAASPSSFTYVPPVGSTIDGNYYCIIINDCCNERDTSQVVIIDPPCFAEIEGPCYMCNATPVTLSMLIFNLPATTTCTYQWTTVLGGNIISPTNLPTVTVDGFGYYCCVATCTDANNNTCTKTACFDLPQCFNNASGCYRISETGEPLEEPVQVSIFPNPTTGTVTITISPEPLKNGQIRVFDPSGKVMFSENIPNGQDRPVISLASLPYGMYFVQVLEDGMPVWAGKVVRER